MNDFPLAHILHLITLSFLMISPLQAQQSAPVQARLDRTQLLLYRDPSNHMQQARSPADWQRRRAEIIQGMEQIMGPLPGPDKRCPLAVQIQEEVDCGTYMRRLLTYASEPNSRLPAYLLIPKSTLESGRQTPAVLCPHPTDNQLGHKIVVGLGGKAQRDYARELAERGYVTLAPAYPWLAKYEPNLQSLGYASGSMKGIWDNIRGLDLLSELPWVKTNAFGAIGHSLGGHNSVYTAVFDPRIKVVISNCGLDSFLDYKDGDITGWTSIRYMPRLLDYKERLVDIPFDFHEVIGALAPRYCFIIAPLGDSNFKWQSVDRIVQAAKPVYELYGVPQHLTVSHPDCAHDFPNEAREAAYQLLDQVLK